MRLPLLTFYFLLAVQLRADVFWRIPLRADTVLQELGGSTVYTTDVQINGASGSLSAHVFGQSAGRVSASLTKRLGLRAITEKRGSWISCQEKGQLMRFLVLPSPSEGETCIALSISQTAGEAARSSQKPTTWPEGMPALAAVPLFSAVCAATRTTFVTAETAAPPEAAVTDAASALRQAGWSEAAPSTPTFRIFVQGRKTCLAIASRNEKTDTTSISLLQREGSTP